MTAAGILLALLGLLAVRAQSTPTILNTLKDWAEAPVEFWENGFVDEPRTMTVTVTDSLPPGKKSVSKISSDDGTRKVEMTLENGQITQLNVDGKDIPPADFGKYDDLTEELRGESPEPPEAPEAPNFDRRAMSPMPPMPGMPPMAGMPPMPPMPAMAPMPGMPPMPPMPGFAPHAFAWGEGAGRTARVYTEKDSSGATVVRIEHGGEPTVLRVQDGAVFINGEKVANGQRISLGNGQALAFGDDVVLSDGDALAPEAFAYSFSSDDGRLQEIGALADAHLADSREHLKELRKELKLQEKELKKQQKAMKKDQKRHMAEAERALAEARRETETAVRASESDHRQAEREARTAQREAETARRDNETSRRDSEISRRDSEASRRMALEAQARAEQFTATMVENLVRDGILTDAKNYSIQFSKKKLVVNGKPQSAEVLAKYLKIFAEREGRDMGDNESYSWEE